MITFIFSILVFKMSNLHQTSKGEDEESESEDDDDEEEDEEKKPEMTFAVIKNQGCVNRIRVYFLNETKRYFYN